MPSPQDLEQAMNTVAARRQSAEVTAATPPAPAPERKPVLRRGLAAELGVTGLDVRNGIVYREYNYDLRSLKDRMERFEEMRRSESAVAVLEQVVYHPLRAAEWWIEPGDDKELAERIERNLLDEMTIPWGEVVRQAALAVLYGFTAQEKVFEEKPDGFVGWRKFAERDRQTVVEWRFDRTGGLRALKQRGYRPNFGSTVEPAEEGSLFAPEAVEEDTGGAIKEVVIPIDKLLVWTWRPEAGDPEGLGVLRQAYKPFSLKQAAEQFGMIRIERQACGMPIMYLPPDALDADRDEATAQMKRIRSGESTGMVVPEGYKIEPFQLGDASVPFGDFIERQHQYILQCCLAQFIGLGQGEQGGTNALSKDASSLFIMALEAVADWIAETFTRYAVAQLCYLNVERPGKLPKLAHGPVGVRDIAALGAFIRSVFGPNAEIPPDVEVFVRQQAGMPATTEESIIKFREAATRRLQKQAQAKSAQRSTPPTKAQGKLALEADPPTDPDKAVEPTDQEK